jgi:hypothetical protein
MDGENSKTTFLAFVALCVDYPFVGRYPRRHFHFGHFVSFLDVACVMERWSLCALCACWELEKTISR